jgi:nanoRNase/pAp phosphatase (c-di-AMP/oligoRNAs hydrolase)
MAVDLTVSREFSSQLLAWVRGKGRILIVAHDNPDPDALASALALQHLLLKVLGQSATLTYGGVIGRGENRTMVRELGIEAVPLENLDLSQFGVVCMVDTQPEAGNTSFPAGREVQVVIDHHPARDSCRRCRWVDIRENYGATATILLEYLLAQEVTFGTRLATSLFYAIKSETQDLGREGGKADRDAYMQLLPLANIRILFAITHPKLPRDYFHAFHRAIENARSHGPLLVFNLYRIDHPEIVAEMADFLMSAEGVTVVLGMGRYEDREILSLRTLSEEIIAGEVMRALVDGFGSAGGHGMTAGGQIRLLATSDTAQRKLEATLTKRLLDILGYPRRHSQKLLPTR